MRVVVQSGAHLLVFAAGVYADLGADFAATAARDKAAAAGPDAVVFDSLFARHWDEWAPYAKRNHLFACALRKGPGARAPRRCRGGTAE